ncbi:MAG TPA: HDOD domain-containing protein [Pirellulales bacterium]|jgi:HD-like signal output (HDOD) protein/GGDEF domain-containing protein|nr:HDOD domain-containing protein [Pirellulales bacterium]
MILNESNSVLDRFVDKAGKLYTLPAVAVEVLQLTNHPKVDVQLLRHCIENDPALTTRVLRVVNSSLFGLSHEVSDLSQALALLGTKPLKLLVLGFSLPGNLFVGMAGDILRRYWRRTLTKAVAAREISETLWKLPGDDAFIAGLLQDVGMLVLVQDFGEPYVRFLDLAFSKAADVGTLAAKSIGFDHARLSARLLECWGLPRNLVEAIGSGRPPATIADLSPTARCLPQILHLAELLAGLLTENRTDLLADLLDAAERYHALRQSQLSPLVNTLQEKVEQLADVLNLELPAGKDYTAVLLEAHERLSEVAADVAADLIVSKKHADETGETESLLAEVQSLGISAQQAARSATSLAAAAPPKELRKEIWADSHAAHAPASAHLPPGSIAEDSAQRSAAVSPAGEVDPAFLGELGTVAASCRQARCALSLLLVGVDRFEELALARGVSGAERVVSFLEASCRATGASSAVCRRVRDDQFALVLPACDRQAAVAIGNQLLAAMRRFGAPLPGQMRPSVTVSIGIAAVTAPPKNFLPADLIESAERCLHASRHSGGNALKSIEIY